MSIFTARPASNQGFTLTELLAAMAIIAVISAIAIPLYTEYSLRSYRTEVQADLLNCSQALERFNAMNFTYAGTADTDANGTPDGDVGPIAQDLCDAQSVRSDRYDITINAPGPTYVLTATPDAAGPLAGEGNFTLDNVGNKTWDENADGDAADADEDDWNEDL